MENNPCQTSYGKWYLMQNQSDLDESERFKKYLEVCAESLEEEAKTIQSLEGIVAVILPEKTDNQA